MSVYAYRYIDNLHSACATRWEINGKKSKQNVWCSTLIDLFITISTNNNDEIGKSKNCNRMRYKQKMTPSVSNSA